VLRTFVLALTLSLPLTAFAQEATDRYRTLVDAALEESAAGRWEEARALFRQAHEVSPNARTLRGIGMASYELRDYAEAVRMLAGALDSTVTPLTEEQRAQVTELLGRARAFVGRYEVDLPEGASLSVDGAAATLEATERSSSISARITSSAGGKIGPSRPTSRFAAARPDHSRSISHGSPSATKPPCWRTRSRCRCRGRARRTLRRGCSSASAAPPSSRA
jgi:hypothetical protein